MLQLILGELNADRGIVRVADNISYASQEPWLFSATIKKNIIFTSAFRKQHYDNVVQASSLLPDFQQLPSRDCTVVGERGTSLSGGQKARINLARCVYNEAEVYLFDDPLSAVDVNVGRILYEQIISPRGLLKSKTRILVTHQTQYINEEADVIVWLEDGCLRSGNWKTMRHAMQIGDIKETPPIEKIIEKEMPPENNGSELKEAISCCDVMLNGKVGVSGTIWQLKE